MTSNRHIARDSSAEGPTSSPARAPAAVTAPAESTRNAVLAAARSLALDVGFRRTTIADVARRAGVSRMTVYREFADIGAIWSRLLTDELVTLLDQASAELAPLPNARARIVAASDVIVDGIAQHPLLRRALDVDPEMLLPLIVDRFGSTQRAALERLEDLIRVGQQDGSVRTDVDPAAAAGALLLAAQSFIFSARALETRPDAAAIRAQLPDLAERYLAP